MKRNFKALFIALALSCAVCPLPTYADWTYGTAKFRGEKPIKQKSVGGVQFYYNGTLKHVAIEGGVDIYECTGDVCVIFPKNYSGRKIKVKSTNGTVQIQYLR